MINAIKLAKSTKCLLAAASILLVSSSALADFSDPSKAILLTADHPSFTLTLKSNPTTGYRWVVRHYDRHLLSLLGQHFHAPNTQKMGAPGYVSFDFKAKPDAFVAAQKTKINLEYVRPWEAKTHDAQKLHFTVVTTPKS
jgi:inhibitor of cysteine peptidase